MLLIRLDQHFFELQPNILQQHIDSYILLPAFCQSWSALGQILKLFSVINELTIIILANFPPTKFIIIKNYYSSN